MPAVQLAASRLALSLSLYPPTLLLVQLFRGRRWTLIPDELTLMYDGESNRSELIGNDASWENLQCSIGGYRCHRFLLASFLASIREPLLLGKERYREREISTFSFLPTRGNRLHGWRLIAESPVSLRSPISFPLGRTIID